MLPTMPLGTRLVMPQGLLASTTYNQKKNTLKQNASLKYVDHIL